MKVNTEITLSIDNSEKNVVGYCHDLSGTGMLIEVTEDLGTGATCQTSLPSSNDAFPALDATIKVLRCTRTSENKYFLGAEIVGVGAA